MIFIEVLVPKTALTEEQRRELGRELAKDALSAPGVEELTMRGPRHQTQVVVTEADHWVVGDPSVDPGAPPRYLVRVSVPRSWHSKEMSAHLIPNITEILGRVDGEPNSLRTEPRALIQIVGIPGGSLGLFGRPLDETDITDLVTRPFRDAMDAGEVSVDVELGRLFDPICGMTVADDDKALTYSHKGTRYGFCSAQCRQLYVKRVAGATA